MDARDFLRCRGEIAAERRMALLVAPQRVLVGERQIGQFLDAAGELETAIESGAGGDIGRLRFPALGLHLCEIGCAKPLGAINCGEVAHFI